MVITQLVPLILKRHLWSTNVNNIDKDRDSLISSYFQEVLSYSNNVTVLRESHGIQFSLRHLHRILRSLTLRRRVYSDTRSVVDFVVNSVENSGRNHGYRFMRQRCVANGLSVRNHDVATILRICDPIGTYYGLARISHYIDLS